MIRVLVALSPQMYREAVALSVHRGRPGTVNVRLAPPEAAEAELASFRPHLLVRDDTAPLPERALEGVSCEVEILYSGSMDARVRANGMVCRLRDVSTEELLRTVAVASALKRAPSSLG
jgi:hypothetical protein